MVAKRKNRNKIEVSQVAVVPQDRLRDCIGVRLDITDQERLKRQAGIRRLPVSTMARMAIGAWLDQIEAA